MSQWQNQLNALKIEIETKSKQLALIEQLIALEAKHTHGEDVKDLPVFGATANDSDEDNEKTSKRRVANLSKLRRELSDNEKNMKLPSLLIMLGQQNAGRSVTYKELAEMVQESGYSTESKNFSNMVYQSLQKLVNRGFYTKNDETREYQYVGK